MKIALSRPCVVGFANDGDIQTASHFRRQHPDECVGSEAREREALTPNLSGRESAEVEQTSEEEFVVRRNCAAENPPEAPMKDVCLAGL